MLGEYLSMFDIKRTTNFMIFDETNLSGSFKHKKFFAKFFRELKQLLHSYFVPGYGYNTDSALLSNQNVKLV